MNQKHHTRPLRGLRALSPSQQDVYNASAAIVHCPWLWWSFHTSKYLGIESELKLRAEPGQEVRARAGGQSQGRKSEGKHVVVHPILDT